ncbi:MAG: MFS transporter [Planctomycetota bacterium]
MRKKANIRIETSPPTPSLAATPTAGPALWALSFCRLAEAIALGMLVPFLPVYLMTLATPWLDAWLAAWSSATPGAATNRLEQLVVAALVGLDAEAKTALLFSATAFGTAAIQIAAGRLSDAFDVRKPLIVCGMIGATLCGVTYLLIETFESLFVVRVLQGMCVGLTFPPLLAIVARNLSPGRGGRVLGTYTTIRMLGFASGPPIGGWISHQYGHVANFSVSALLLGTSALMVALWVNDAPSRPTTRAERRARPKVPGEQRILGCGIFIAMAGVSGIISLFPSYQREFGATEQELGLCFSAFLAGRVLMQYPTGWLGDHYDKKYVLLAALALFAPLVTLQGFVTSLWQLGMLRIAIGGAVAAISSCIGGMSAERSVDGNRARVMGINTLAFSFGVSLGPLLTGFLADARVAFALPGVASVVLAAVVLGTIRSDRAIKLNSTSSTPSASAIDPDPAAA